MERAKLQHEIELTGLVPKGANHENNFGEQLRDLVLEAVSSPPGGLLIAVVRGRLTEGVDLSDRQCRAV